MRTTHTRIIRAYFAYMRMSIRAHTCVYTRVCVSLLCMPPSFFVMRCWTNKGHFWNEKARGFNAKLANCEKRQ